MQIQSYLGFSLKIIYAKNFQLLQIKWILLLKMWLMGLWYLWIFPIN